MISFFVLLHYDYSLAIIMRREKIVKIWWYMYRKVMQLYYMNRDALKGGPVLLSNCQAVPDRNFS